MERLLVKDIRRLLKGILVKGSEDWYVNHAIIYGRQELEAPNTLIFLFKNGIIDWKHLNALSPCAIITDQQNGDWGQASGQIAIISVQNTLTAHREFMEYYRSQFNIPVVAITGTCGKTTTKEMIRQILCHDFRIQSTESSKNEPRRSFSYLMGIDRNTQAAVFETGFGNPGNIKHQCLIYRPTIGIITMIDAHHLDHCKTIEDYIQAKGEMVEGLEKDGTLIINGDDDNIKKLPLETFKGKIVTFGCKTPCDFLGTNIRYSQNGMEFDLVFQEQTYSVFVPGYGEHQVYNALASLAAVCHMGLDFSLHDAINKLKSFKNMERHLEISKGIHGSTIIDDTWTINPASIEAAINVMDVISKGKKKIILLGNINRLGDYEKEFHQKVGSFLAKKDIHTLITIGEKAEEIGKQAKKDGFKGKIHIFQNIEGVKELLLKEIDENTHLLIKGPMSSRSMIELAGSLKL